VQGRVRAGLPFVRYTLPEISACATDYVPREYYNEFPRTLFECSRADKYGGTDTVIHKRALT